MIPGKCVAILTASFVLSLPVSSAAATTVEVEAVNFAFVPDDVTIAVGDTVRWVNKTSTFHTTTSGEPCAADGLWDSEIPSLDSTFSFVFDSTGTFPYFCIPHCGFGMTGVVTVETETPAESSTWGKIKALYR